MLKLNVVLLYEAFLDKGHGLCQGTKQTILAIYWNSCFQNLQWIFCSLRASTFSLICPGGITSEGELDKGIMDESHKFTEDIFWKAVRFLYPNFVLTKVSSYFFNYSLRQAQKYFKINLKTHSCIGATRIFSQHQEFIRKSVVTGYRENSWCPK